MKKTSRIIAAIAVSLFATNAIAQGPYVKVNAGYNFGLNSTIATTGENAWNPPTNSGSYEAKKLNFGKGINLDGAFGFMVNKNVGFELGLSYLLGGKTELTEKSTGPSSIDNDKISFSSSMFRINPSVVLSAGFEKINPYAKFGLLVGFGSIKMASEFIETNVPTSTVTTTKITHKLNGGLALGFNSAFGIEYLLNEKMAIFGELSLNNLTYAPKKGLITEYTVDGVDQLPNLTTNDKEIEFVDSYTFNSASPIPDSSPDVEIKENMPFNSFGLNFGIKIGF